MALNEVMTLSKRVLAHDVVNIRGASGGENPPLIVSIPRAIANAVKVSKGDRMQIYTDGERIYLERLTQPTL